MPPPDKHTTIAYAAGASLAAITLVYVFGPTWFIDSANTSSSKERKRGVVGLENPANDCFINSILQALAGLEDLRSYLSQQTNTAKLNGNVDSDGLTIVDKKPFLTAALKEILDSLNERPIYRKTISNQSFLVVLEKVFRRRISRAQQDAHEFLQVVAETLAEEHHKQKYAIGKKGKATENVSGDKFDGMPLEGRLRSEIECQKCQFKPRPTLSTFVVLTLPVPQKNSVTLSECIDGTLSTEYIEGFQCAQCRLLHTISSLTRKRETATSSKREAIDESISKLQHALKIDPEIIPDGLENLLSGGPKSRISRRTFMQDYPDIITLHLSRSIYDMNYASRKNTARVSFPEHLRMGGLVNHQSYSLLCVVIHKGGHDSGHYECFRRQIIARPPFSTPTPNSLVTVSSVIPTSTDLPTIRIVDENSHPIPLMEPRPSPLSGESSQLPTILTASTILDAMPSLSPSTYREGDVLGSATTLTPSSCFEQLETNYEQPTTKPGSFKKAKRKNKSDRWWRISDDKIKEATTSEVLGSQKEAYLLFYQIDREGK